MILSTFKVSFFSFQNILFRVFQSLQTQRRRQRCFGTSFLTLICTILTVAANTRSRSVDFKNWNAKKDSKVFRNNYAIIAQPMTSKIFTFFKTKDARAVVWSSGQPVCLLLRQSEFMSCWNLQFFCKICVGNKQKKRLGLAHLRKNQLRIEFRYFLD